MKKLLLLLMTGFCSPVIHAQQQTADFTGASEICFPDSLSRISEGSSDSLIYFTGGFVTPVHFAVNRDVPQPNVFSTTVCPDPWKNECKFGAILFRAAERGAGPYASERSPPSDKCGPDLSNRVPAISARTIFLF